MITPAPELRFALARGYKLKRVHRALQFERSPVLATYCTLWREQKELQDRHKAAKDPRYNASMREITKLLLNSLYGKTIQKQVLTDSRIVRRVERGVSTSGCPSSSASGIGRTDDGMGDSIPGRGRFGLHPQHCGPVAQLGPWPNRT